MNRQNQSCKLCVNRSQLNANPRRISVTQQYTIMVVTHNMQQASRIADWTVFFNTETTVFFNTETDETGKQRGKLVEFSPTEQIFKAPKTKEAAAYIGGQFG